MSKQPSMKKASRAGGSDDEASGAAIGARVKQLMDAVGLKTNQLDRMIDESGSTSGYTSRLTNGRMVRGPGPEMLQKIADALHANVDWIACNRGEPGAPIRTPLDAPQTRAREIIRSLAEGVPGVDRRDLVTLGKIKPGPDEAGDEDWWQGQLKRIMLRREALEKDLAPRSKEVFQAKPQAVKRSVKSKTGDGGA